MSYRSGRQAGYPQWMWWLIGATTVLAIGILILAVVLGIRAGQQQVEIQTRQQVGIHLQRAIDLRIEGNLEAALREYQQVLMLDPGNMAAVEGIDSLLQLAVAGAPQQPMEAPTPVAASPLAEPTSTVDRLASLWTQAQDAYTARRWKETVEILEGIRRTDPNYQPHNLTDMLFTAYVNLAAERDSADNLEEALVLVDKALDLRPNSTELRAARSLAAKYLDILTYFGADWERAAALLEELYAADPDYRDVEERLHTAYVALGETLLEEEEWCTAADRFIAAIDIDVTPGLIAARDRALAGCRGATPEADRTAGFLRFARTPTATAATPMPSTPTEVAEPPDGEETDSATAVETRPLPAGRLMYAAIDPDDGRSRIFAQETGSDERAQILLEDGTQPAMRGDGRRIVYVNTRNDMSGLSSYDPGTSLSLRFTEYAEDRRPSWSADGNRIVFASNREGDRRWRIYVAWAEVNGAVTDLGFGDSPAWHPSQEKIAYRGCDETGNRCGLWTMSGSGAERAQLTSTPADTQPAWSPDGRYVVFVSAARDGNAELYRVDVASRDVTRVTRHPAVDTAPTVSPDGTWVAYLSNRGGSWQIWGVPISGGDSVVLAALEGNLGRWEEETIQWLQ